MRHLDILIGCVLFVIGGGGAGWAGGLWYGRRHPGRPERSYGTCDWGDCDDTAVGMRYDSDYGFGWLPVCARHEFDDDEDVPRPGDSGGRTAAASALATMADFHTWSGHSDPGTTSPVTGDDETWPVGDESRPRGDGPGPEVRPATPSPAAGRTIYPEPDGAEIDAEPFDRDATYDDITPLALASGELPEPPADIAAWWRAELDALLFDGQSPWFTEMSASRVSRMLEAI